MEHSWQRDAWSSWHRLMGPYIFPLGIRSHLNYLHLHPHTQHSPAVAGLGGALSISAFDTTFHKKWKGNILKSMLNFESKSDLKFTSALRHFLRNIHFAALNVLKRESANYSRGRGQGRVGSGKNSPPLAFINKVLLEHHHGHLLMYYVCLLWCYNSKVEQLEQRQYGTQSLPCLLFGSLKKLFVDSCPKGTKP